MQNDTGSFVNSFYFCNLMKDIQADQIPLEHIKKLQQIGVIHIGGGHF